MLIVPYDRKTQKTFVHVCFYDTDLECILSREQESEEKLLKFIYAQYQK